MAGIVSAPDGWQEMVAEAIASATRPIVVDERFAPRATSVRDERGQRPRYDRADFPPARAAATLLLLYPRDGADGPELVTPLTVRHGDLRAHAGEVSLPGGAVDPDDEDRAATALREAREEVDLDPAAVTVAGSLDPIWIPVSNFELLPVVATATDAPDLSPHEQEVAAIVELPIRRLFEPDAIGVETFDVREWRLEAAAYRHADLRVWGATARTLAMLAAVLAEAGIA